MKLVGSAPRVQLRPPAATPLSLASRLSEELGLEVWLKRDDLTGIAFGGNKVRTLEFVLGDALAVGADCLVTGAGAGSNWAMLATVAARTVGLPTHLAYYGDHSHDTANSRLAVLSGATVTFTGQPHRDSVDEVITSTARRLEAAGAHPYVLPRGGATAIGALGYVHCAEELQDQLSEADLAPESVWIPVGSCGTHAGLLAGRTLLGTEWHVTGVATSRPAEECRDRISAIASEALHLCGCSGSISVADVEVIDGFHGPGYGHSSEASLRAAELVARTEGIFLDPVFGSKAMAGLVAAARDRTVIGPVVFIVTGGAPSVIDHLTTEGVA